MNSHADKTQANKSHSMSNAVSQKQSGRESTFQFVDNRPEAVTQRKLQTMANNSPQAKHAAQLQASTDKYSAQQYQPIQKKENNTGLPDNLKSGIENLSGHSMDDVKVHYNSDKPAQLQAHAYAQGTDIHIGSGQEKHLPHEAWHVVQQKQGKVKPTLQMMGKVSINDDEGLEKEADVMGAKALQLKIDLSTHNEAAYSNSIDSSEVVQRVWKTQGPGKLKWEGLLGGLQWYFHREDDTFSYRIQVDTLVPMEQWTMVERHEGEHLSEPQLDHLGFEEIEFVEGDDRVEYEAPEPEFGPVDASMVTNMGEQELVALLSEHLVKQTALVNYDRLSYINAFLIFMQSTPLLSFDEALANFDIHAPELLSTMGGGHCGALSGSLLEECESGAGAYLVASKLPADFQQAEAPEYCHVAAMIRFQNPESAEDAGLILLEPGFNITTPIVIKEGVTTSLLMGDEIWDFYLNHELTEVICQPKPAEPPQKPWKQKKVDRKRMTYRTDVFLNPDMSLTAPLLRMDGRPQILARDELGNVIAVISVNYAKERIELRIGKDRFDPIPFTDVDASGNYLGQALTPLSKLLKIEPAALVARLFDAVDKWRPKDEWRPEDE